MSQQLPEIASILVSLDGSDLAEAALPPALAIVLPGGADIHLLTVALTYDIPVSAQLDTVTRTSLGKTQFELQSRIPGVTQTTLAGDPAEQISKHASKIDADLIVMATHGRSGFKKLLLGSVSDKVLTQAKVPVLLVKENQDGRHRPTYEPASISRILVPLDGNEAGAAAAPYGMAMANLLNAEAVLVYVDEGEGVDRAKAQAEKVAARFDEEGLTASVRSASGEPGPVIAKLASEEPESMVVMSSLSATGIARGTHRGSVTDYVVKNCVAPVLVVRPVGYIGPVIE